MNYMKKIINELGSLAFRHEQDTFVKNAVLFVSVFQNREYAKINI